MSVGVPQAGSRLPQHGVPLARFFGPVATALALLLACGRREPTPEAEDALRIAVPYDVSTLDPAAIDRLDHFALLVNVFEPLVMNDGDLRIRPSLAERWENPDEHTWVFQLRSGVRFHGGKPLTAADVVYTIQRLRERPDLECRSYVLDVVEARAPTPYRVVIRTASRSRTLLSRLNNVLVVPEGATEDAIRSGVAGTGPYAIEAWRPGGSLALRRHAGHWSRRPLPQRVEFALARGPEEALGGLLAGRYRLVRADSRSALARVEGRFRVARRENLFTKMLAFDHRREVTPYCSVRPNPFRDRRVRRALDLGLDRGAIVKALPWHAVPAHQPVPRSVFGFDPGLPRPAPDTAEARRLLREAGLGAGFGLTLHTRRVLAEGAQGVRAGLATLGIRADVEVMPDAEYFAFLARGGPSVWFDRFGCTTGEASELLEDLVHSPNPARHLGTLNFGGFADPELDRLIEGIAALESPQARRDALQRAVRMVVERLPVVSLFNDEDTYAMDPTLRFAPRADSYLPVVDVVSPTANLERMIESSHPRERSSAGGPAE